MQIRQNAARLFGLYSVDVLQIRAEIGKRFRLSYCCSDRKPQFRFLRQRVVFGDPFRIGCVPFRLVMLGKRDPLAPGAFLDPSVFINPQAAPAQSVCVRLCRNKPFLRFQCGGGCV